MSEQQQQMIEALSARANAAERELAKCRQSNESLARVLGEERAAAKELERDLEKAQDDVAALAEIQRDLESVISDEDAAVLNSEEFRQRLAEATADFDRPDGRAYTCGDALGLKRTQSDDEREELRREVHRLRSELHGERILREQAEKRGSVEVESERTYGSWKFFSLSTLLPGRGVPAGTVAGDLACHVRDLLADNAGLRLERDDLRKQLAEAQAQLAASVPASEVEALVARLTAEADEHLTLSKADHPASAGVAKHKGYASGSLSAASNVRALLPKAPAPGSALAAVRAAWGSDRVYTETEALEVMLANPCARFECRSDLREPMVYRYGRASREYWHQHYGRWQISTGASGTWHRLPDAATADEAPGGAQPAAEASNVCDAKRFWADVDAAQARVDAWPAWKRGVMDEPTAEAKAERKPPFQWDESDKARLVRGATVMVHWSDVPPKVETVRAIGNECVFIRPRESYDGFVAAYLEPELYVTEDGGATYYLANNGSAKRTYDSFNVKNTCWVFEDIDAGSTDNTAPPLRICDPQSIVAPKEVGGE